jgi:predicted RNA-binding protein with PUA-like domain
MAAWLFKTEPESWSWDEQKARGEAGQEWDGVRNFQARNHMRAMRVGDRGFFYHTGGEKRIVGVVEVIREAHPESKDAAWECVDVRAVADMPQPLTLEEIKAEGRLADMVLVKNARLSVQPVTEEEWRVVCRMGGLDPEILG